jgi:hypothetical protein
LSLSHAGGLAGPKDPRGRSLRDFDLRTRLFKYPCSFLIYSESFTALPAPAKEWIYQRLWDIFTDKETSQEFVRLPADDRKAIREILIKTLTDLPGYWK